ncbi:uncharacterized protein EDB91DRAFT_1151202 [Suillus paluster]|uniref:uncharacterized protein n=1 Tax=Suillus paluster TaxID=48578 RepID=UPI001B886C4A|nr:uncharacterized protein EDB91DRAFT_1151202 [Suillus paluster]KAG1732641.1 hypothetical protein EDB91DRAFT_1151202 [Suillus paluster]
MSTDEKLSAIFRVDNHDEANGDAEQEQLHMMKALPYSMVRRGLKDIYGVVNYVLDVKSANVC